MLKRLGLLLFLFLLGQAFASAGQPAPATDNDGTGATNSTSLMSLALKAVTLNHGEHGIELWRLRATWANMAEQGGSINVEAPHVTYLLPPDNQELVVVAEKGQINQTEQRLAFEGNVVVTNKNSTIKSSHLVYDGQKKTMNFPQGGDFAGDGIIGTAQLLEWRMNDRVIEASNGVDVTFERPTPDFGKKAAP